MLVRNDNATAEATRSQSEEIEFDYGVNGQLAGAADLTQLLSLKGGGSVDDIIQTALLSPVEDLTSSRGKRIRGQLVHLANRLVTEGMPPSVTATKRCRTCAEVVELIHAGSLVVDDIEDGSETRRGKPALHVRYGLPIALNAGNWLYFWPFELIKELQLPSQTTLSIYESYHRTLLRAHFGQALDLGSRVDRLLQSRVAEVCLATMTLKTGALMGFAMALGAAIGEATEAVTAVLDGFGRDFGIALQMFDDLGNVLGIREPSKKYEDLMLYRPSWAWACAAKHSSTNDYRRFVSAVRKLPDAHGLEAWIHNHDLIQTVRESAKNQLESAYNHLRAGLLSQDVRWSPRAFEDLRELGEEITVAYG